MSQAPVPPDGTGGNLPPGGYVGPTTGQAPAERAGFWRRFGAGLIDGILVGMVSGMLGAILGGFSEDLYSPTPERSGLQLIIGIAYYVYFHGSASGQTVGKKLLGIRVVGAHDGAPIGYGSAALRYVGSILSAIPCGLGYLWMLWDDNKQTWHDKIASTIVVPESAAPVANWPG